MRFAVCGRVRVWTTFRSFLWEAYATFVYFKFSQSRMVDDSKILPGDYGIVNSGQLKAKEAETVPLESTIKKVCFGFLLSFHLGELHQSEVWFGHSYCASILIIVFP